MTFTVSAPERGVLTVVSFFTDPSCSRPSISVLPAALPMKEKVPPPIVSSPVESASPFRSRSLIALVRLSSLNVPPLSTTAPRVFEPSAAVPAKTRVAPRPTLMSPPAVLSEMFKFIDTVPLSVCVPVPRTVRMPSFFPEPVLGSIRTVPPKSPSLSAWSTMLALFVFALVTIVCTLPALPLSVPARISELHVSCAVAALSATALARSAVRPASTLSL